MADKSIGELKKATYFDDNSLIPAEQGGEAQALSGELLRKFAEDAGKAAGKAAVTDEVEQAAAHAAAAAQAQQGAKTSETNAKTSENAAAGSATKAAQSEKNAAQSAATAQQYSGKPPQPINGTWWIWDAATGSYKDSGVSSILRIVKSYTSIEAMEADYGNMQDNDLVIIATDVELEENSKLYIHTPTGWQYLSDLSGIQGPPGRSAYEVAQEGGYTGSEAEFWQDLTQFKPLSEQAVAAASAAGESERKAQTSEANAKNSENAAEASAETAAQSETAAKTAEDNAKAAQAAAEKARDDAQAIAGGDFMTPAVYDPQGKRQDVFAYADTQASAAKATANEAKTAAANAQAAIPTKTSQLKNDSGFLVTAPVTSVNGATGAVQLGADDIGAAKIKSPNDMLHNGNEFTFIPDGYTGQVYINHRTASGQTNGNVSNYYFGDGKGGLATFIAAYFKGKFQGETARPIYNNEEAAMLSDVPTNTETWTFTLEDGSTVTKAVYVG